MAHVLKHERNLIPPEIEINYRCLKAICVCTAVLSLLATEEDDEDSSDVKMEQFGAVLDWFGNLETDGEGILTKIKKVLACGWFHGNVSTSESENRLIGKTIGTFLVLFTSSHSFRPPLLSPGPLFDFGARILHHLQGQQRNSSTTSTNSPEEWTV